MDDHTLAEWIGLTPQPFGFGFLAHQVLWADILLNRPETIVGHAAREEFYPLTGAFGVGQGMV